MGPSLLSTLYFLASMLRSLEKTYGREAKDHFPLLQWSHFSVLPFSPSPWSNDKVIVGAYLAGP
jgi:hypothetical protein